MSSSSGLTNMVRSQVFTLEEVHTLDNAFNKEMTQEPPLLDTTTEGRTQGFHPGYWDVRLTGWCGRAPRSQPGSSPTLARSCRQIRSKMDMVSRRSWGLGKKEREDALPPPSAIGQPPPAAAGVREGSAAMVNQGPPCRPGRGRHGGQVSSDSSKKKDLSGRHECREMHMMRVYEEDACHWLIISEYVYPLYTVLLCLCWKFRSPLHFIAGKEHALYQV